MSAIRLSFETFPPKHETGRGKYLEMLNTFQKYSPMFQSMTYGAGASDRSRSERLVSKSAQCIGATQFVPHLAGGGQDEERIKELVSNWWDDGIRHIVALRGDDAGEGETKCAADLVNVIREVNDFEISVAGYPETHPKSASQEAELQHLKRKVEAGASKVLTQFFFDADVFLRYRDKCDAFGLDVKVVPGILPISTLAQVQRFAKQCAATVPDFIIDRFSGLEDQPEATAAIAVITVVELIERLNREGVKDFHLYTLSNVPCTLAICHSLGIYPEQKLAA
ncbi:methylenetetrahydrofolate reductase [Curvivirga aplysinae]|uniref:methylenetetrahydrofolate reductase n=1 Tax=Curvivirga aplysinae TaxID=2529852 RepID=UPI0012BC921D|nr:methylenetetrahydrofolate reductase [Curvivirga aplysinae]MTI08254.1 5,10-methylenetetrahydrofolate reductase [Curvivirga aplysinae]